MKIRAFLITAALIAAGSVSALAAEIVVSPDGSVTTEVSFDGGAITYTAAKNGVEVLASSPLGISLADADFTGGVRYVSRTDHVIDEAYEMISAKAERYVNRANEAVFTVEKDGRELKLYVRAYDDGVAVRYGYDSNTYAYGEATAYNFAGGSHDVWAQSYESAYENYYRQNTLRGLDGSYCMPLTVRLSDGLYALVTEVELNGSYAGSVLTTDGSGTLRLEYEEHQQGAVEIAAPFVSPWRVTVMGTLSEITQTQLPENLCSPSKIDDTSWIQPGVSSWTWFNGDPTDDPEVYKQYIDFSAEMGWEYVLLDEGWQPLYYDEQGRKCYNGLQDWTQEVLDYAAAKGIGIFVWAPSWDLDTEQKRERLKEWADMGIKGIKVDFFNSESQETLRLYDAITETAARLHLMVDYHGCNKPSGERRTWPHLLTREAVQGTEHFLSGEGWGATAEHNCILPFTRNAVGPMDFTPAVTNYNGKNYYTIGQKAALPVVFESGIQCLSDKPENYRQSALYDLYRDFPAAWDETRLIDGVPGSYAVIFRRSGSTSYIGIICNAQRTIELTADFIDGTAVAELYLDGTDETSLTVTKELFYQGDIITIPLAEHGGAVIKLTPTGNTDVGGIGGHWCGELVRSMKQNGILNGYFAADFKPDECITRGEFVMMLDSAFGIDVPSDLPPFSDSVNHRTRNYIAAAVGRGIINGVSDSEFAPDAYITREQAATIIGRYLGLASGINIRFADKVDVSDYALMYVSACADKGIIDGYDDNTFRPRSSITRAETAAILSRAVN